MDDASDDDAGFCLKSEAVFLWLSGSFLPGLSIVELPVVVFP